jgi:hypothetical protein
MTDWRKSSYSHEVGGCVGIRGDLRAIRDTKELDGPVLVGDVRQLVRLTATGTRHHGTGDAAS